LKEEGARIPEDRKFGQRRPGSLRGHLMAFNIDSRLRALATWFGLYLKNDIYFKRMAPRK
jgi:hypothetical protein